MTQEEIKEANREGWRAARGVVVLLVGLAMVCLSIMGFQFLWTDPLNSRGGAGETCYPNGTCEVGLTCFQWRDERQCEKEVRPVYPKGKPICYELIVDAGEDQRCFETRSECLTSYARALGNRETEVGRGCTW